jgi:membrane-associated phospholipid phosphatase
MHLQYAATSLGDLFPAGCVVAGVILWCWLRLSRLVAAVLAVCFIAMVAATFGLKLVAIAYAPPLEDAGRIMLSQGAPSGHAASAMTVYGCAAAIFARSGHGLARIAGLIWCAAAILVVCVTRLTLHAHTVADIAAGLAVGVAFVALFDRALRAQTAPASRQAPPAWGLLAAMVAIALLALASGVRITSTEFL